MSAANNNSNDGPESQPDRVSRRVLTLFDCVCIIVGTIIGAGIFKMPAIVADKVPDVNWLIGVWIFGGVIALIGALCFAELTTTYPDRGGDYGYLKRAFSRHVGFAFSWAAFWVIRPGNIGAMAMIFGEFAAELLPGTLTQIWFAIAGVVAISGTNLLGIVFGKMTQNVLTVAKVVGILLIVVAAFALGSNAATDSANSNDANPIEIVGEIDAGDVSVIEGDGANDQIVITEEISIASNWSRFWLAMVFVMFAFGGWNDIAFVASEVRQPKVNLVRSLMIGTGGVLIVYLLVNLALVYGIGFDRMSVLGSQRGNPTSELVEFQMGAVGLKLLSLLVCISCLGAINAMIFTSPRIYWATATDYPALNWLAGVETETETKAELSTSIKKYSAAGKGLWRAMLLQGVVTILCVIVFGNRDGGIELIVNATAPYFWMFLALTIVSLIVSRFRFKGQFSGYRVPLFPVLPIIFIAACIFMTYQAVKYTIDQGLIFEVAVIGGWVVAGAVLSFILKFRPAE